jgi:hypothetical protein
MVFCTHCGTYSSDGTLECPKCQSHLSEFGHNSLSSSPNPPPARRSRLRWHVLYLAIGLLLCFVLGMFQNPFIDHQAGPEATAVSQLRTINTFEVTYLSSNGEYGNLPELISAGLLDSRFEGPVSGYTFTVQASGSNYTATAIPTSTNAGRYGYFSLGDAVLRWADAAMKSRNCGCLQPVLSKRPVGPSGAVTASAHPVPPNSRLALFYRMVTRR